MCVCVCVCVCLINPKYRNIQCKYGSQRASYKHDGLVVPDFQKKNTIAQTTNCKTGDGIGVWGSITINIQVDTPCP